MGKKIIVVSSTFRKDGNSETLADAFIKGAIESGHSAEKINLRDIKLEFCKGCLHCQKPAACVIKDGVSAYLPSIQNADVLVFATPIYYYEMAGQLKTFLDRLNPLYPIDYKFKDIYILASAAEDEDTAMDGAIKGVQGWIDCFGKASLKGIVRAIGVTSVEDIHNTAFPAEAYKMGKNI